MSSKLWMLSVLVAVLLAGCAWDSSLYDMYAVDGYAVSCPPHVFVEINPDHPDMGKLVGPSLDDEKTSVCVDESGGRVSECVTLKKENGYFTLANGLRVNSWDDYLAWNKSKTNILYVLTGGQECTAAACPELASVFKYGLCPVEYSHCKFDVIQKGFYCRAETQKCKDDADCEGGEGEISVCLDDICQISECKKGYHFSNEHHVSCERDTSDHCGSYDVACKLGQVCLEAECRDGCSANMHIYEGACESDDLNNCGSHANDCRKLAGWVSGECVNSRCFAHECDIASYYIDNGICKANEVEYCGDTMTICSDGETCLDGECVKACVSDVWCTSLDDTGEGSKRCVDPQKDMEFCGASGNCDEEHRGEQCNEDAGELCVNGHCELLFCMTEGESLCEVPDDEDDTSEYQCVDLQTDINHCGYCNYVCDEHLPVHSAALECIDSQCKYICHESYTNCGESSFSDAIDCVDLQTDVLHCGRCDTRCGSEQSCLSGLCCDNGLLNCNSQCVNTKTDASNCSECGKKCASGQICSDSKCCDSGQTNCNGSCVNTKTSANNCGACGAKCGGGQVCSNGKCCNSGLTNCSNTCVNLKTDAANCNGCGIKCASGQTCSSGRCCDNGLTNCSNTCVNTKTSTTNCGACGVKCGSGQTCSSGRCCDNGLTNCSNTCVSIKTSTSNCGACGTKCGSGQTCSNGKCCNSGLTNCSNTCVNLSSNANNCGSCGNKCGNGKTCKSGKCS